MSQKKRPSSPRHLLAKKRGTKSNVSSVRLNQWRHCHPPFSLWHTCAITHMERSCGSSSDSSTTTSSSELRSRRRRRRTLAWWRHLERRVSSRRPVGEGQRDRAKERAREMGTCTHINAHAHVHADVDDGLAANGAPWSSEPMGRRCFYLPFAWKPRQQRWFFRRRRRFIHCDHQEEAAATAAKATAAEEKKHRVKSWP